MERQHHVNFLLRGQLLEDVVNNFVWVSRHDIVECAAVAEPGGNLWERPR